MRKYGMKRHFYDNIPIVQRQVPKDQYREGISGDELEGYSDEVKQAFSLNNASETEITRARFRQVRAIFGQHSLDVGNQAIQACMHCEKTISLMNHLRVHHKDISALIKL